MNILKKYKQFTKKQKWHDLGSVGLLLLKIGIKSYFCTTQIYEYIRIDMIVNQDNFFTMHVTTLRTIWTQTRQNLAA